MQVVDLFTGEQYQPPFEAINLTSQVPVREDAAPLPDRKVRRSLKYLADKTRLARLPGRTRRLCACINERMDWINTSLLPRARPTASSTRRSSLSSASTPGAQAGALNGPEERAQGWLKGARQCILGADTPTSAAPEDDHRRCLLRRPSSRAHAELVAATSRRIERAPLTDRMSAEVGGSRSSKTIGNFRRDVATWIIRAA